jgi:hypothetical protein
VSRLLPSAFDAPTVQVTSWPTSELCNVYESLVADVVSVWTVVTPDFQVYV